VLRPSIARPIGTAVMDWLKKKNLMESRPQGIKKPVLDWSLGRPWWWFVLWKVPLGQRELQRARPVAPRPPNGDSIAKFQTRRQTRLFLCRKQNRKQPLVQASKQEAASSMTRRHLRKQPCNWQIQKRREASTASCNEIQQTRIIFFVHK
jgi:hypothetical protein